MMSHDQQNSEVLIIDEISHLTDQEQADYIANKFSAVSCEYEPLRKDDIKIEESLKIDTPIFTAASVLPYLQNIKKRLIK